MTCFMFEVDSPASAEQQVILIRKGAARAADINYMVHLLWHIFEKQLIKSHVRHGGFNAPRRSVIQSQ